MRKFFNNTKFRTKLLAFTATVLTLITFLSAITIYTGYYNSKKDLEIIEQIVKENFDNNIKSQTENVITMLYALNKKYEAGELSLDEAKILGADLVRDIRYNKDGYFWVDTFTGQNIVMLGSDIEGTDRNNYKDAKGTLILAEIFKIVQKSGSGFLNYWFPKSNQSEPVMKRSYVQVFEPFEWIIGTGNYIDDIDKTIADKSDYINTAFFNRVLYTSILLFIVISLTVVLVFSLAKNITDPLHKTTKQANLIANGVLNRHIDSRILSRRDEIGQLANSIETMKISIRELFCSLNEKAKMLALEKELFGTTLKSIGDGVISTNQEGKIVLLNTVSEKLTGWTQYEAAGKPFDEIFTIVNDQTNELCANPVAQVLELKEAVTMKENTILITRNNDRIPIEDSASPIKDKYGNIIGTVLVFRDITEKKDKQKRIEYLCYHDQLTGLYNRRFFEEEFQRLDIEENLPITIAMADVNGLKLTNDAFGHNAGDELLRIVSNILKKECRKNDIISRIGGDEFVILLPRTNKAEAKSLISHISKSISEQRNNSIIVSVSIGMETKSKINENIKDILSKAEVHMYSEKIIDGQIMRDQTIKSIMQTLYAGNMGEKMHSKKVSELSRKTGEVMKLDIKLLDDLETTGLLHDVGKITLDSNLLNKPTKLTQEEYAEIKKHCEASYHILKSTDIYTRLAEYVLSHHERWDGKGYPRGLVGEETPLAARIIAVADSYEAMTSKRPYKTSMTHTQALAELTRCAGTQFDPTVVDAFKKLSFENSINDEHTPVYL